MNGVWNGWKVPNAVMASAAKPSSGTALDRFVGFAFSR